MQEKKHLKYLRELVSTTGFPITSTLAGISVAYPGEDNSIFRNA